MTYRPSRSGYLLTCTVFHVCHKTVAFLAMNWSLSVLESAFLFRDKYQFFFFLSRQDIGIFGAPLEASVFTGDKLVIC